MSKIEFSRTGTEGHAVMGESVFRITGMPTAASPGRPSSTQLKDGASITPELPKKEYTQSRWKMWGSDNNQPKYIFDKIAPSIAKTGNLRNTAKILGRGVMPCTIEWKDGEEIITPFWEKPIKTWWQNNQMDRTLFLLTHDMITLGNANAQIILSVDGNYLNRIARHKMSQVRYEVKNYTKKNSNKIEFCGVSGNWPNPLGDDDIQDFPVLDVNDPYEDLLNRKSGRKFCTKISFITDDEEYYSDPFWYGAILSGYVDIGNDVPNFTKAIFKNQMAIKYHVELPYSFFELKFKDWTQKKEEDRIAMMTAEFKLISDCLAGSDNAGKAFWSVYGMDQLSRKELPGVKITVIDDKFKQDAYLPTAAAANTEILTRQMIDPTTMGAGQPGGSMKGNSGAGSDKREADLLHTATMKPFRDPILEHLYLAKRFNEWEEDLEFRVMDTVLTTLDQGSGTKKVVS